LFTIAGAFVASPVAAAVLIALGGASSNFLLGRRGELASTSAAAVRAR